MSEQQAYPLSWPDGWPRTKFRSSSNFVRAAKYGASRHSMQESADFLIGELDLLGATKGVLSTNIKRRLDGVPYSGQAQPTDPGAALYFELKGKPVSLACDKWNRVEDNVWAIAKHIEALRGQNRWGVGSIEQAFRGYTALPAVGESEASSWWKTLGVAINATTDQVRAAYRILAKNHHPDNGGDVEMFRRLSAAMERFEFEARERERRSA
jgi:DnaJ domain